MDGNTGAFGAVGAARDIRNPIKAARVVMSGDAEGLGPLGLVRPILVVGEGAVAIAREAGLETNETGGADFLVTERARSAHALWNAKVNDRMLQLELEQRAHNKQDVACLPQHDADELDMPRKRVRKNIVTGNNLHAPPASSLDSIDAGESNLSDTVGAIVIDVGRMLVATGISSGGALLKPAGRVGDAALYGCGCHADVYRTLCGDITPRDRVEDHGAGECGNAMPRAIAAACTSGTGEHIMRCNLASAAVDKLLCECVAGDQSPPDVLRSCVESTLLRVRIPGVVNAKRMGGIIAAIASAVDHEHCGETGVARLGDAIDLCADNKERNEGHTGSADAEMCSVCRAGPGARPVCVDIVWAHTTPSMVVGFRATGGPTLSKANVSVSRMSSAGPSAGKAVVVSGICLHL
eukprot:Opistho-2@74984